MPKAYSQALYIMAPLQPRLENHWDGDAEEGILESEGEGHQMTLKDPFLRGRYFLRQDSSLLPQ